MRPSPGERRKASEAVGGGGGAEMEADSKNGGGYLAREGGREAAAGAARRAQGPRALISLDSEGKKRGKVLECGRGAENNGQRKKSLHWYRT